MDLSARIMAHALTELVVENSVPELAAAASDLALARETQALSIIRDIVEDGSLPDRTRISYGPPHSIPSSCARKCPFSARTSASLPAIRTQISPSPSPNTRMGLSDANTI